MYVYMYYICNTDQLFIFNYTYICNTDLPTPHSDGSGPSAAPARFRRWCRCCRRPWWWRWWWLCVGVGGRLSVQWLDACIHRTHRVPIDIHILYIYIYYVYIKKKPTQMYTYIYQSNQPQYTIFKKEKARERTVREARGKDVRDPDRYIYIYLSNQPPKTHRILVVYIYIYIYIYKLSLYINNKKSPQKGGRTVREARGEDVGGHFLEVESRAVAVALGRI